MRLVVVVYPQGGPTHLKPHTRLRLARTQAYLDPSIIGFHWRRGSAAFTNLSRLYAAAVYPRTG